MADSIPVKFALSPATVSGNTVIEDNLSKILSWSYGQCERSSSVETSGTSTTVTIYTSAAHGFAINDILNIGGEVAAVATVPSAQSFTVSIPMSAAPASGTTITPSEQCSVDTVSGVQPICMGEVGNDSEITYHLKGGMMMGSEISAFKGGESVEITHNYSFANWERSAVTAATTAARSDAVVVGVSGTGLSMLDASGARYNPCVNEVTVQVGISHEWTECIGATNGKAGYSAVPIDGTAQMTLYQDGTMSNLEDLVGTQTPILIQIGSTRPVGVYFPEAYISEYPVPVDIGMQHGVKVAFRCGQGYIYRG